MCIEDRLLTCARVPCGIVPGPEHHAVVVPGGLCTLAAWWEMPLWLKAAIQGKASSNIPLGDRSEAGAAAAK